MKKETFAKILVIPGIVLVLLPILAPFGFGLGSLITDGKFRFDYLLPAELGIFIFAGAILLLAAAFIAHSQLKLIGWSLVAAILVLVGGQAIAVVTGLASGKIEPTGWQWALVLASLAIFYLAVIVIGIGGIKLAAGLFKKPVASH